METQTNTPFDPRDPSHNTTPPSSRGGFWGSARAVLWDLLSIFFVALLIIVPFRTFVAEPYVVAGSSMLPNYHNSDYLIIDRLSYRFHSPERGDVVVLKFPRDTSQYYIKRIVGLPGEQVSIKAGGVYIYNQEHPNGWQLKETYLRNDLETISSGETKLLGSDEYFVLGDNRTASSDSRVWGILPRDKIIGKVWLRAWPAGSFGLFEEPEYN